MAAVLVILLGASCGSDVNFRRFEVGPADPLEVLEVAAEVVKTFYAFVHGGLTLDVDRENLKLETGYVRWRTDEDLQEDTSRVSTSVVPPRRQKLYLRVYPSSGNVHIEMLATIEVLAISDPDAIETADDLWKFVGQDTMVEDLIYEKILQRLLQEGELR
jgi:hypothetical protein